MRCGRTRVASFSRKMRLPPRLRPTRPTRPTRREASWSWKMADIVVDIVRNNDVNIVLI